MLQTLLVALAVVGSIAAIVAFCIIITKRQTRRNNQALREAYLALLAQHNINPDFSQVLEHRILAMDSERGVFVFVQHNEEQPSVVIELADVGDCRLWKDGIQIARKVGSRGERVEEYISAVGLSFMRKSGVAMTVPIYSEVLDGVGEKMALTKAADQWLQKIKAVLAGTKDKQRLTPVL